MKSIRTLATVVAVFGMGGYAQAGLLDHLFGHKGGGSCDAACDASKCCDCAPTCEPECCKPVIVRPQQCVYTYQRQISCLKPPACHDPCVDACCDPCEGVANCGPACAPGACDTSCGPKCCMPTMSPVGEKYAECPKACVPGACGPANAACAPSGHCCPTDACCDVGCCERDYETACEVAQLIYEAQTACDAEDREAAIDDLGDYDARCYPEIMCTLLYSLNDADPEVREEACDEIGDLFEDYPCLATQCVIDMLTCSLADCNDDVVAQAEEALEQAGYEIVDACDVDDVCCEVGCVANACAPGCAPGCAPAGQAPAAQPAPMPGEGQAPAPAPPQDTKAYFPRSAPHGQPARKFSLSRLFSSLN